MAAPPDPELPAALLEASRDLRHRVAELETLLSVIPVGIGIALDRECRHIQVNPAFASTLGLPPDANASLTAPEGERPTFRVFDAHGREVPPDQLPMQVAAREGREIRDAEFDIVHPNGVRRRLLEYAVPLFDDRHETRGAIGAFIDITERRQAEARNQLLIRFDDAVRGVTDPAAIMARATELLGHHLNVSRCVYADVAADGDTFTIAQEYRSPSAVGPTLVGTWTLLAFGPRVAERLRTGRTVVVDDYAQDLPDQAPAFEGLSIGATVCAATVREGRLSAMLAVHESSPRLWRQDEIDLVQLVASRCWDSIARARAVRELRASEERLLEMDQRKDEFLAVLAHELRNPLVPLRTGLEFMRLATDRAAAVERVQPMMERQVSHMVRLIDDLLDVSRITSGKIQLRLEPIAIEALVRDALDDHRAAIEAADLDLTVELPSEPCYVSVDPARFVQVLSNLIHNAAKFTDRGGRINIRGECVPAVSGANELRLVVRDTGSGIPGDALPRIFELFSQGAQGVERGKVGLGIGLALARRLMEMHGGTIEAASDGPGRGATFTIRMPVLDLRVSKPDAPDSGDRSLDLTGFRVLIVDDNRDAADALAMALVQLGADVDTVYDGESAVGRAMAMPFDAVLLDIGMPGIDGYEACGLIRRANQSRRPSMVALTGFGQERDRERALQAGFDRHLTKPADLATVHQVLHDLRSKAGS